MSMGLSAPGGSGAVMTILCLKVAEASASNKRRRTIRLSASACKLPISVIIGAFARVGFHGVADSR
jgi:hypothetical protein